MAGPRTCFVWPMLFLKILPCAVFANNKSNWESEPINPASHLDNREVWQYFVPIFWHGCHFPELDCGLSPDTSAPSQPRGLLAPHSPAAPERRSEMRVQPQQRGPKREWARPSGDPQAGHSPPPSEGSALVTMATGCQSQHIFHSKRRNDKGHLSAQATSAPSTPKT